jgi:hypothetical protein
LSSADNAILVEYTSFPTDCDIFNRFQEVVKEDTNTIEEMIEEVIEETTEIDLEDSRDLNKDLLVQERLLCLTVKSKVEELAKANSRSETLMISKSPMKISE